MKNKRPATSATCGSCVWASLAPDGSRDGDDLALASQYFEDEGSQVLIWVVVHHLLELRDSELFQLGAPEDPQPLVDPVHHEMVT